MGAISPLGNDVATTWAGIVAGRSGVAPITRFDTTEYRTTIAAEVKGFDPKSISRPRMCGAWTPLSVCAGGGARGRARRRARFRLAARSARR